jgi:hypothetical protein
MTEGAYIAAGLLLVGMLFSRKTRRALVVPTMLAAICWLPFALFAIGIRINVDFAHGMLIVVVPMYVAPWLFIVSALFAMVLVFDGPGRVFDRVRPRTKLDQ